MKTQCDICNRTIEPHLQKQSKGICFSCLTEEVTNSGAIPVFAIKEKPMKAPCVLCEVSCKGTELFPSPWGFICRQCCDLCETQTGFSWELMTTTSQREWLVKSNKKILGPHTNAEIEQGLRENRFVPHDEIMPPAGRWHMIRDVDVFRAVVNEVRNKYGSKKDVITEVTASGNTLDPLSPQIRKIEEELGMGIQDKVLRDVQDQVADMKSSHLKQASRDLIRVYAPQTGAEPSKNKFNPEIKKTLRRSAVVVFVLGILAAYQLTKQTIPGSDAIKRSFQDAVSQGLRAEKAGDYSAALTRFNEARAQKPKDPELLLHLAPLTLFYDRQVLQAQRMFEEVLASEAGVNYKRAGFLGLGLVALESHDLNVAKEQFGKALGVDQEYLPAVFNSGVVSFLKEDLAAGEASVFSVFEKGTSDGAIVISLADIYAAQATATPAESKKKLHEALKILDTYSQNSPDYSQEVAVVQAKVLSQMGRPADAKKKVESMMDQDPEGVDLHLRDWTYYRGRASWGLLTETLRKLSTESNGNAHLMGAQGLGMYRSREKLDGAETIRQASRNLPKDPVLLALSGWVDVKLGRKDEGLGKVKEAAQTQERLKLPHILMARYCFEDKDYVCAKNHWDILYNIDPKSMEAIAGFAQLEWAKKNSEGALRWLLQGQALDPSYIPFLTLAQEIQDNKEE